MDNGKRLGVAAAFAFGQTDRFSRLAHGNECQPPRPRRIGKPRRMVGIGIDHCNAAILHHLAEQAQLGGEVILERGVIVHVIAGDVGEAAGGDDHAIQAVLVETVAGGFDGKAIGRHPASTSPAVRRSPPDRGVVCDRGISPAGDTSPTVPRLAAGLPSAVQISRRKATMEDLPLVPVTAATMSGCAPKKAAAKRASPARGLASSMKRTPSAVASGASSARPAPPRRRAPTASLHKARAVGFAAGERGRTDSRA